MGRGKQITVLVFITILLFGCVYLGIQVKNKPKPSLEETVYEGSYKETTISLPVINKDGGEQFLQLLWGLDDSVELYTILYNEDKSMVRGYKKYVLNSELKWEESQSPWMELEDFSDTTCQIRMLAYADTGSVYVLLHDLAAEVPVCDDIVRIGTDGTVDRINSLANGTLFAKGENAAIGSIASDGEYLYLLGKNYDEIIRYRIANGQADAPYSFAMRPETALKGQSEYEIMDYRLLSHNGTLYLSCQDGIYRYNFTKSAWKQLMTGLDCIFGRPSIIGRDFIATQNALYMFSRDYSGNYYFTMYSQRTQTEDEKLKRVDFTILSYDRSDIITETAAAFQHNNPSLRVLYRAAHEEDESLTIEGYRSQVQKELQEKNVIDVLVCDELDYQSYMDSGLFENISDLMKPLYTAAGLYGNVTNAMAQTKIFVTPAKFEMYLMYGTNDLPRNNTDFASIAALSQKLSSPVLGSMNAEEIAELLGCFYEEAFLKDGSVDKEALNQMLTVLPSVVKLSKTEAKEEKGEGGENDSKETSHWFGMPSFSDAAGHFVPRDIVGINSKSANIKTAKDFVHTLYSDSVQQADIGEGIPMQQEAVEAYSDRITESNLTLFSQCLEAADTVYTENTELREALLAVIPPYLNGEITADEATAQIMNYTPATMMSR